MGKEDMGQQNTIGLLWAIGPDGLAHPAQIVNGRVLVDCTITLGDVNVNVKTVNVKDYTDIRGIVAGNYDGFTDPPTPPENPVNLTAAQIHALFDKDDTTTYYLEQTHGMIITFKTPNYVYDLEVVDANGQDVEGEFYPIYTDGRTPLLIKRVTSLKVEAKLSGFIFVNRGGAVTLSKIIVREFEDSRVNAPKWQPLNVNELGEVVWEDIDLVNSQCQDSFASDSFKEIAGHVMLLFDKQNIPMVNGNQFQIQIYFKRPISIGHLKLLGEQGIGILCEQWQAQGYFTDGTQFQYQAQMGCEGCKAQAVDLYLNKQVACFQLQAQNQEAELGIAELLMTIAHTVELSTHADQPADVQPLNEVTWADINLVQSPIQTDIFNGYFSGIPEARLLFDKSNAPTISAQQLNFWIYFKRPINIGQFKLTDFQNQALGPLMEGQWQAQFKFTDGTLYQEQHQSGEGEHLPPADIFLNKQVAWLQFQIQSTGGAMSIAECIMTIAHTVEISSDTENPVHVRNDDEVLFTDIDLAHSYFELAAGVGTHLPFDLNYLAARQFFDKVYPSTVAGITKFNLAFKKPMNAGYVKFIDSTTGLAYEVPTDQTWQATFYYTDGTEPLALTIEGGSYLHFYINAQLTSITLENVTETDPEGMDRGEVVITLFREVEISSSPTKPVYVVGAMIPNPLPVTGSVGVDELDGLEIEGGSAGVIDHFHRRIHGSKAYHFNHTFAGVGNGSTVRMHIKTPAALELHTDFTIVAVGNMDISIVEGSTFTANGTAKSVYNLNRTTPTATGASVWHTPTVLVPGTAIYAMTTPSGALGTSRLGAMVRNGTEIILAPDTEYTIDILNNSGVAADIFIAGEYYEEA